MSNTIGLTIDGVQVASATVSSLANLETLLTADAAALAKAQEAALAAVKITPTTLG